MAVEGISAGWLKENGIVKPQEVRAYIKEEKITGPTAGMCPGYAQANLVVLPKEYAYDFLLFTQRNPKSCPVLKYLRQETVFYIRLRRRPILLLTFQSTASMKTVC